ncbi:Fe-S cluster assembly protein SufD [Aliidiomarina halalkaliphila]|uniref:Fe-S cluster assembly protein SufD n=1 Tax=Aliidiomarina halalkaliphila TaxID=2593535 RepID=A0A552X575_9GAMM|nr:Fe-S cluster assembly protein SufD [Aliidiomarina halalkaliphila]TRW50164.1 Fe-S cluster assembly protein SufD [Aliidiomarina halalkaliphila]
MSDWLAQVIDRADAVANAQKDELASLRQNALAELKQQQWPTRRTEAWRYTSLHPLEDMTLPALSQDVPAVPEIDGVDSLDFVFVNGKLQGDMPKLPKGVSVGGLTDSAMQAAATEVFGTVKPRTHLFGLVNDVLATDGLVIDVAAGAKISQPLRILNFVSAGSETHHRVLVRIGDEASVSVIEHGAGSGASVNTAFAEYALGAKARLEHYRFALHGGDAIHIGGAHFSLGTEARLNSTLVGYGSQLSRLDYDVIHAGQHANAKLNAVYLLAPREHFDLHTNIEHAVPNGTTEENARGIIGDRARAVFNGRIHIHRDAQKTLAELNNRNLLLSRGGTISTKPELEIYADDVQCAHGATVAEIDDKALYYMLSRGIKREQALVMLNFGFIQELVAQMPNKALAKWLEPQLRDRFMLMDVRNGS